MRNGRGDEREGVVTDWVSVSEPFLSSIPQRRKHFSWLNGHWPEHKCRPGGHQGKIVRRGSNEVLRATEKLNGFSRNVISEWKSVVNYHFLHNRLPQKGDFSVIW